MTVAEIISFENSDKPRDVIKKLVHSYNETANQALQNIEQEEDEVKKEEGK